MPHPEAPGEARGPSVIGGPPNGSVWELKPWWCQPWSILLTGVIVMGASWLVLHLWWITAGVSLLIGLWWLLFLVLMPAAWSRQQSGDGTL